MNIANFIKIYTNIYIYITLYVMRMTQNKNHSIKSVLQHGRDVDKNCCVAFSTSGCPYLILCPRQCKWKVATTCLAITTKNNWNIWIWKSPALKPVQITKRNIKYCDHWEKIRTIILSYLSGAFLDKVN